MLGSTGFVGRNLIDKFKDVNINYVGGSRRTGVDARDVRSIIDWIMENDINILVNLSALCGGIGANKLSPADFWAATTQISCSVLEASRITKINKLVNLGTICSYPAECPTPFKEEYLLRYGSMESTNLAYGMAKLNYLFGAQAYKKQYNLNSVNVLPVNMYGIYDNFDLQSSHVIPAMINKFYHAKINMIDTIVLWGDGSPTREFLYAKDFADAIVKAIEYCETDEFINVGSGNEISMKDLADLISRIIGYNGQIVWDTSMPNGQMRRCLDVSKAEKIFNFKATTTLEAGLTETINWYTNEE